MSAPKMILLKLALRAAERGDSEAAAESLRGVIAMAKEQAPPGELRAVGKTELARMLGCSPEHIGHLIKRGEIPAEAVLGHGRGERILVDVAIAALQRKRVEAGDDLADEGAAYVRRRGALRVVRGAQ